MSSLLRQAGIARSTRSRATVALAALAVAAGVTTGCSAVFGGSVVDGSPVSVGCGFGTSARDVTTTIRCSGDAIARQDAVEVCALQTSAAQEDSAEIELDSGARTCVAGTNRAFSLLNAEPGNRAALKRVATNLQVTDVQVSGAAARATVSDGAGYQQQVALRIEGHGWRLEHSFVMSS